MILRLLFLKILTKLGLVQMMENMNYSTLTLKTGKELCFTFQISNAMEKLEAKTERKKWLIP